MAGTDQAPRWQKYSSARSSNGTCFDHNARRLLDGRNRGRSREEGDRRRPDDLTFRHLTWKSRRWVEAATALRYAHATTRRSRRGCARTVNPGLHRAEIEALRNFVKNEPQLWASSHFLCMAPAILAALGDFRGPVIGAAGTRYFEPDGVVFCDLACPARPCQPATVSPHPLPVALPDRSAPAFH